MKRIIIIVLSLLLAQQSFGQFVNPEGNNSESANQNKDESEVTFRVLDVKPSFKGGDANEFSRWVSLHMKYPEFCKENGVQGKVVTSFVINEDGRVVDVKVLKGVDPALDREAVRVVSSSPKWKPGKIDGKPVRVVYTFPVIFQMR